MKRLPEFAAPHLQRIGAKYSRPVAVRRIKHACGHEQGHPIEAGYMARQEYREIARQPCGACAGAGEGNWDGPDLPEYDTEEEGE